MKKWFAILLVCPLFVFGGQWSHAQESDDGSAAVAENEVEVVDEEETAKEGRRRSKVAAKSGFDEEEPAARPSTGDQLEKLVALGPGVHAVKKDSEGRVKSCMVVGQASIRTVLGKAKGLEMARSKANLACSAEFVKWLQEEVNVYLSSDEENVVLVEGSEEGDAESLKESGKSIEKQSQKMESVSKGLVRGLQLVHKSVDDESKTYTIVKGWKADSVAATKKIQRDLAADEDEEEEGEDTDDEAESDSKKPRKGKIDKKIKDESVTSDDADEFLSDEE